MTSDVTHHSRQRLTAWAETFLGRFREGLAIRAEQDNPHEFNVPHEVYARWRGQSFYLVTTYRVPRAEAPEDAFFDAMNSRFKHVGGQRFDLAYMRHTGRWHTVFYDLPLEAAIDAAETTEIFWPLL